MALVPSQLVQVLLLVEHFRFQIYLAVPVQAGDIAAEPWMR
jgi:hypothetical protein